MIIRKRIISLLLISIVMIGWGMSLILYRYYQPAKVQPIYAITPKHSDDTIRILFMGDSWAAYHADYDTLLTRLVTSNIGKPCKVKSIGYVGAKSKEIYERLFTNTKPYIMEHPDYCIISAGINDAVAKMGTNYYKTNYSYIVIFLLSQRIIPVVLDMPNVDYRAVYSRETLTEKMRHNVSSIVTGANFYSFQTYKAALFDVIEQSEWQDSLVYIDSGKWMPSYNRSDFYCPDGIHLNATGYQRLDSCLSKEIQEHRNKNSIETDSCF